MSVAKSKQVTF